MIDFRGRYFTSSTDGVRVKDEAVQEMIDEVIKRLKSSKENFDFGSVATGDSIIWGVKSDGQIDVYFSRDYKEACLLYNEATGKWEPVDWFEENEYDALLELDRDELIEEIMRLRRGEYDPSREV